MSHAAASSTFCHEAFVVPEGIHQIDDSNIALRHRTGHFIPSGRNGSAAMHPASDQPAEAAVARLLASVDPVGVRRFQS